MILSFYGLERAPGWPDRRTPQAVPKAGWKSKITQF